MWISDFILSIMVAGLFLGLLFLIVKPSREANNGLTAVVFLFLALFLPIWAAGTWVGPMGPTIFGMYALPFLLVGLGIALLLAAVSPPRKTTPSGQPSSRVDPVYTFGPFFFAFVIFFLFVIFMKYLYV